MQNRGLGSTEKKGKVMYHSTQPQKEPGDSFNRLVLRVMFTLLWASIGMMIGVMLAAMIILVVLGPPSGIGPEDQISAMELTKVFVWVTGTLCAYIFGWRPRR